MKCVFCQSQKNKTFLKSNKFHVSELLMAKFCIAFSLDIKKTALAAFLITLLFLLLAKEFLAVSDERAELR